MNALATIEHPIPAEQANWLQRGVAIAQRKRDLEWDMADWINEGTEAGYVQVGFEFLSDQLGVAPKRLKDALKAAKTFPPAIRDAKLSVEHHVAVASLPKDEALPLLKRASTDHMPVNELREHVTKRRYETGQRFDDEDMDSTLCTHIVRAWNRATPEARRSFMELAETVKFQIIDEDEVNDGEA